jgi:hypothetical protein
MSTSYDKTEKRDTLHCSWAERNDKTVPQQGAKDAERGRPERSRPIVMPRQKAGKSTERQAKADF